MKVNPSIFKSRDIRGIYPLEMDEKTAFKIGQAFVVKTGASQVVVGRDMRLSSPVIFESLTKGIISQGADVLSIGQVATECLYFAVVNYNYDAGIMITASHNPKEYNGFKMLKRKDKGLEFISGKDLINLVKNYSANPERAGKVKELNIWEDYISHIFSFVEAEKINPFKVVIDAGNGMAGKIIPLIKDNIPVEIIPLNFKLDGNFPAHPSNPLLKGSTNEISEKIIQEKADFGFIFDGDADRIYLLDEKGKFIQGDTTLLLLAKYLLLKHPKRGIAYNLICSKAVPEFIKKWEGVPIRTAVGVVNVKKGVEENNGIMGGELSGHYLFRDNYYLDSGLISFLILLQIISASGEKVSKLTSELSPYFKLAEISFKTENKEGIVKKIKEKYSDGKQDFLDGITVEYKNWWFNVRPSQTEPLLRLSIEADAREILEEKKKELISFIAADQPVLQPK